MHRKPTDAELALYEQIKSGMMFNGGLLKIVSCPLPAFRALTLTAIMAYTDSLANEEAEGDG